MHIISKQKKSLVLGIYIKFHSTIGAITLEKKTYSPVNVNRVKL